MKKTGWLLVGLAVALAGGEGWPAQAQTTGEVACPPITIPDTGLTSFTFVPAEPPLVIVSDQVKALQRAILLLGEGDRLKEDGDVEGARAKWLAAVGEYQAAGDRLGEAEAYLRLADSYQLEAILDPSKLELTLDYYQAGFFAAADVYETLIQKEIEFDQETLGQADTLFDQGLAAYQNGDCETARPLLDEAKGLYENIEFGSGQLRAIVITARCQFANDDYAASLLSLLDGLLIASSLPLGSSTTERYAQGMELYEQGQWDEAAAVLEAVQAEYEAAGKTSEVGQVMLNRANIYAQRGDYQKATELYQEALAIFVAVNDDYSLYNQATTHHNLGNLLTQTGRYPEAMTEYTTAIAIWPAVPDPAQEVVSRTGLGLALHYQGRYTEALTTFRAALDFQRRTLSPDPESEGDLLNNIGQVYHSLARYEEAIDQFQQALVFYEQLSTPQKKAQAISNVASAQASLGRYDAALAQYQTVLTLAESMGHSALATTTHLNMATLYVQRGDYQRGLAFYQEVGPAVEASQEPLTRATFHSDLGAAYKLLGDLDKARAHFDQALQLFDQIGNLEGSAKVRNNLGLVALQAGLPEGEVGEAASCFQQSQTVWVALNNPAAAALVQANLGWLAVSQQDWATALSHGEEALRLSRSA
ncbi:MAG: tetratricopeptide repeat protein, partial [Chloroflexota bacterium]